MSNRRIVIAANWKMNKSLDEVTAFFENIGSFSTNREVIIAVPFPFLQKAVEMVSSFGLPIQIAAQNCHEKQSGAYTGEVSFEMLKSIGVNHVILGHSERRQYNGENDEMIADKLGQIMASDGHVIWCCGENLEERNEGKAKSVVEAQFKRSLSGLQPKDWSRMIIAYEPVWAIGTGEVATPEQAEEMHEFIRSLMPQDVASEIRILYGGSMKPANAQELLSQSNVDGGLIGGASLQPDSFKSIIETNL